VKTRAVAGKSNTALKNVLNYVSKVDKLIEQEKSNQFNEK